MKKKWTLWWCLAAIGACAQPPQLKDILQGIEANNPELRLFRQQNAVQEQTDRTLNNLENPGIEYIHQWGTPGQIGNSSELNVTQSFDFPTLYGQRNKLIRERFSLYQFQYQEARAEVLLRAQKLCYDLATANKKLALIVHEKEQINLIHQDFQQSVEEGMLTSIQGKKLKMELMNLHVMEVGLYADREKIMQELAILNGGTRIEFSATALLPVKELIPFEQFCTESIPLDARLISRKQEQKIAERETGVNIHQNLPSLELGYRRTTGFEEEFNGVILGVSVPLFQNRGKVKQARLQQQLAQMRYETERTNIIQELRASYEEVWTLKKLLDEYGEVTMDEDWCDDLKRAYDAHEITTIEYFTELSSVHGAYMTRLELENRYYKALADLYRNYPG